MSKINHQWVGALFLFLAASIWGGMYVISKYVLQYIPPFTLLWMRYCIAWVVLYGVLRTKQQRSPKRFQKADWYMFAKIGFIGYFLSVGAQFIGTKLSDAHTGALITAASPVFTLIFARMVLKEHLSIQKIVSLVLTNIGMWIVIGVPGQGQSTLLGNLFLVAAAVTWALLSVFAKQASERHSALVVTTYSLLFAIFMTTPVMVWENLHSFSFYLLAKPSMFAGILYLGIVSTAVAFFCWNKGLEYMDASIGSLFIFFQTLVGAVLGWFFLHEHLDWSFLLGGLCIVAGVGLVTRKQSDVSVASEVPVVSEVNVDSEMNME
ncbi:DMT family transporter [Fodinisporobacter ferrooxydans]|uniref:DMT family transporter n=1 Tax=Fodinisporobacter ferrooxydans TaxID=2901836 RepID=A0ABY4CGB7_9BACL|nr:DMT family transporter [Alicyclobacillaceae bacterium MYW30-H2]